MAALRQRAASRWVGWLSTVVDVLIALRALAGPPSMSFIPGGIGLAGAGFALRDPSSP